MHIPPNGGPGPHRHDFEETFIVLDGKIQATWLPKVQTASLYIDPAFRPNEAELGVAMRQ